MKNFNLKTAVAVVVASGLSAVGFGTYSANDSSFGGFKRTGVGLALGGAAMASQAAAIDVSGTITDIAAQLVPIGLVGGAVLGVYLALKAFHWVRRAMA